MFYVFTVINGVVNFVWEDTKTLEEFYRKYHGIPSLDTLLNVESDKALQKQTVQTEIDELNSTIENVVALISEHNTLLKDEEDDDKKAEITAQLDEYTKAKAVLDGDILAKQSELEELAKIEVISEADLIKNRNAMLAQVEGEFFVSDDPVYPGQMWDGKKATTPEVPIEKKRVGVVKPRSEFAVISATQGWITDSEALNWVGGTAIPKFVDDIITANIPEDKQLAMRVSVLTQEQVGRMDQLILMLMAAKNVTAEEMDIVFGVA